MSENEKLELLSAWLDDALTPAQRSTFEQLCLDDPEFAARVRTAGQCFTASDSFVAPPLPAWDKSATFTARPKRQWFVWQGLPMASMAMSVLAMVMVISGFRVDMQDNRLSMGFGDSISEADIAALVDQKVDDYKSANQAVFRDYADALARQQRQSSAELTEYLLASSRKERREDFAELIEFINEQRTDDQRFFARQLHNLQQDVSALESSQPVGTLTSYPDATPQE